jgi:hypothetical protein
MTLLSITLFISWIIIVLFAVGTIGLVYIIIRQQAEIQDEHHHSEFWMREALDAKKRLYQEQEYRRNLLKPLNNPKTA